MTTEVVTVNVELHHLQGGNLVIYKREGCRTSFYYARVKLPNTNRWKKFTTKTGDFNEAVKFAVREYEKIMLKLEAGLPLDSRSFKYVPDLAIEEMQQDLDAGMGKASYHDYIRALEKFKDFFKNKYLANITNEDLRRFDAERTKELGRKANKSTINTHNAAINRVFKLALEKGWIAKQQVPHLKNDGKSTRRRPHFEIDEYRQLFRFLRKYANTSTKDSPQGGVKERSIMVRELLRDYVLFLANTGLRPGTETRYLKWKHISEFGKNGKYYLQIKVPRGKTGSRTVIARHSTRKYLQRIKDRFPELKELPFTSLGNVDDYVFRLRDGTMPHDLHGAFKRALEECELLKDAEGNVRSLYSLRHTYATFQLLRDEAPDLMLLAQNMGTSVLMLERHYSHVRVQHKAEKLAGDNTTGRAF
jgi:integrase